MTDAQRLKRLLADPIVRVFLEDEEYARWFYATLRDPRK